MTPAAPHMERTPKSWLEPLPLAGGRRALPCRILPGPMEGVTDGSFCRVMARRGLVRAWVTPFIRISTAVPRPARLCERLDPFFAPAAGPVVVQLMGTDIPLLLATAERVAELGAAGVDLNCACPSKVVLANGAGGARLRDPHWIREALGGLRRAVPGLGVSVKLRAGFADSATELPAILAAVREAHPDFVMMHFRTAHEEYRAVPDGWRRLAAAKRLLGPDIPLLGAGDLFSAAAALDMWRQTGVDGVTPARGLLRNPWLLREIEAACGGAPTTPDRAPAQTERAAFLRELVETSAAADEWRPGFVLELARNLFGVESPLFAALAAARTPDAMLRLLLAAGS